MAGRSKADWSKLVKQWQQSGLPAKEFSQRTGVTASTLSWWKWRLGSGALGDRRLEPPGAQNLVEIVPLGASGTSGTTETAVEIVLGDVVVRVRSGFDARTLGRVLDVLEGEDAC